MQCKHISIRRYSGPGREDCRTDKLLEAPNRVRITKAVFDGLQFIRTSDATTKLARPMALNLARERGSYETADWIESVDTRTYSELIFQGPEVIDAGPAEYAADNELNS